MTLCGLFEETRNHRKSDNKIKLMRKFFFHSKIQNVDVGISRLCRSLLLLLCVWFHYSTEIEYSNRGELQGTSIYRVDSIGIVDVISKIKKEISEKLL